ncbi:MAG: AraC family transcriptional regulator [Candidatus Pacebacteria bacterium]|nr:AraC family transcriptional regulator [Candidatus Paceibacterota bacterium]
MNLTNGVKLDHIGMFEAVPGMQYADRHVAEDCQEIEIITMGRGCFLHSGTAHRVDTGSMIWYAPGELIVAHADEHAPYQACVLRFRFPEAPPDRPPFYSAWENVSECLDFCGTVQRRHHLGDYRPDIFAECVYARLFWEAHEYTHRSRVESTPCVRNALNYIEKHFTEPLSIEQIAREAGVSSPHLYTLFRQHVGISPKQAILKLRLKKAESLLSLTTLSVKEISRETGFIDASSFCAFFRRASGLTPIAYRKRQTQSSHKSD